MNQPAIPYSRIGFLCNPISGGGKAAAVAGAIAELLAKNGLEVSLKDSQPKYGPDIAIWLADLDLVCIAGGDGTLRSLLPWLAESATPWYMLPAGNESLAARYLGMTARPSDFLTHIKVRLPQKHYFATFDGEPFFSMASLGFDSWLLEHIGERRGPSSNWLYLRTAAACLGRYHGASLTIQSEQFGSQHIRNGYCIIANNPAYARGVSFTPRACSQNTALQIALCDNVAGVRLLRIAAAIACRRAALLPPVKCHSADALSLLPESPYPVQLDGDTIFERVHTKMYIGSSKQPVYALGAAAV